jgi:hypothetical protein
VIDEPTLEGIAAAIATLTPLVKREAPAARSCEAAKSALERAGKRIEPLEATNVAELALRYVCDRAIALPRLHDHQHLADAIVAASAPPATAPRPHRRSAGRRNRKRERVARDPDRARRLRSGATAGVQRGSTENVSFASRCIANAPSMQQRRPRVARSDPVGG